MQEHRLVLISNDDSQIHGSKYISRTITKSPRQQYWVEKNKICITKIDTWVVVKLWGRVMVLKRHFQQYFNYIVAISFIGGGNIRPASSHWQTWSHNVISSTHRHERNSNFSGDTNVGTDCTGSCKSNYHTITTTTGSSEMCVKLKEKYHWTPP